MVVGLKKEHFNEKYHLYRHIFITKHKIFNGKSPMRVTCLTVLLLVSKTMELNGLEHAYNSETLPLNLCLSTLTHDYARVSHQRITNTDLTFSCMTHKSGLPVYTLAH